MKDFVDFQNAVVRWCNGCFGMTNTYNIQERNWRFLEQALELVQSLHFTEDDAHALVDYVFSRPVGEVQQEIGGVMVTLAALSSASSTSLGFEANKELARINNPTVIQKIREKQETKPGPYNPSKTLKPKKVIAFKYRNHRGVESVRHVHPYGVVFLRRPGFGYQPGWFLYGWDMDRGAPRSFSLSHIVIEDDDNANTAAMSW